MRDLTPKLFQVMRQYSKEQFVKDIIAGVIVAIIALPLSIALALASGVKPEQGLYTAIIAGFIISFFGGSRVQISGPTAAFATIVAGIVAKNGMEGLIVATVMAGILLTIAGLCKLGNLIKFIPITITVGFTSGIAITIFIGQIKDFAGLTFVHTPIETIEKVNAIITSIETFHLQALGIGVFSLLILIVWPKINKKIPGSLIAVIASAVLVKILNLEVNTIGSLYEISNQLPTLQIPQVDIAMIEMMFPSAVIIALLAGIESLLSCVVSDGMIQDKHNSNTELIAQGIGNICSALFGGIPATGAIARTAANVKNGGRTPISGMVHAIVLCVILVVAMPYAALIPMPAIAAILFVVAYNMSSWRTFVSLLKTAPKSDILVLVVTFLLTIVFDLVVAIQVGFFIALILFLKRMTDVTNIRGWKYIEEESNDENLRIVPKNTLVYEIVGPMFFAVTDQLSHIYIDKSINVIILRMKGVPAMDATAMDSLQHMYENCKKHEITLLFSHVQPQPMSVFRKAGFVEALGIENFCDHTDQALERAQQLS